MSKIKVKVSHQSGYKSPYDGTFALEDVYDEFGLLGQQAAERSVLSGNPESNNHGLLFLAVVED